MFKVLRRSVFLLVQLAVFPLPLPASEPVDSVADTLSGQLISDIKPGARRFIVTGDLYVPPGTTVKIEKGTVFLFENFVGFHVQGTLLAQGTPDAPIVFTSRNDREWNSTASASAAPFDWNGIDLDEGAIGTEFSDCMVRYSVFGIKSQTERFRLKNITFALNGKTDLVIKGERITIDKKQYSYGAVSALSPGRPIVAPERRGGFRMSVRYSGLALAVGGIAAGLWGLSEYPGAKRRFQEINTPDDKGALLYTSEDWRTAKRIRDRDLIALIGGCAVGVIGAAGFVATFTFYNVLLN